MKKHSWLWWVLVLLLAACTSTAAPATSNSQVTPTVAWPTETDTLPLPTETASPVPPTPTATMTLEPRETPTIHQSYTWKCWDDGCKPISPQRIADIAFVSDTEAWAVGADGQIVHWDGKLWHLSESPTTQNLNALAFVSVNDGWAVGNGAQILHWDGSSWRISKPYETQNQASTNFYDVAFVSSTDGWAVGGWTGEGGSGSFVLHWNGSEWQGVSPTSAFMCRECALKSITTVSGKAWVVGWGYGLEDMPLFYWDGSSWTNHGQKNKGSQGMDILDSVSSFSSSDVWVVGYVPYTAPNRENIFHWDGTEWKELELPNDSKDHMLLAVLARTPQDVFVGGSVQLHWDGKTWESVELEDTNIGSILDIATSPQSIWALTDKGVLLQLEATR